MARTAIIEITRKPTPRMVEALRTGAAHQRGIVDVCADKRTHEGLVGRGLADWIPGTKLGMRNVHTSYCVIIKRGRDYLATLDRPETGPADVADVTDEEITEGVEDALKWLPYGTRDEARSRGAVSVLAAEFKRSGAVWRRLAKQGGRIPVETQALRYYGKVQKLLAAARLREQQQAQQAPVSAPTTTEEAPMAETPATPADAPGQQYGGITREDVAQGNGPAPARARAATFFRMYDEQHPAPAAPVNEPADFRGLTRADVAHAAAQALETLTAEDRAVVEGKAPSVVLGLAFRRAQSAWCATRREHTAEESAAYERCANIASAAGIFERADDPEAARAAYAESHRITNEERAAESKRIEEARAAALVAEWSGAERHGKYLVRTEDRGHGIVAVYVKGPDTEISSIDRARGSYASAHGLRPGASAGGGESFQGEYISQCAYRAA